MNNPSQTKTGSAATSTKPSSPKDTWFKNVERLQSMSESLHARLQNLHNAFLDKNAYKPLDSPDHGGEGSMDQVKSHLVALSEQARIFGEDVESLQTDLSRLEREHTFSTEELHQRETVLVHLLRSREHFQEAVQNAQSMAHTKQQSHLGLLGTGRHQGVSDRSIVDMEDETFPNLSKGEDLDVKGLLLRQEREWHQQDETLGKILNVLREQKEIGSRMHEEFGQQNRLLENMNEDTDRTHRFMQRVTHGTSEVVQQLRKAGSCNWLLIGVIATVFLLIFLALLF